MPVARMKVLKKSEEIGEDGLRIIGSSDFTEL
jgi:hypothetical protein